MCPTRQAFEHQLPFPVCEKQVAEIELDKNNPTLITLVSMPSERVQNSPPQTKHLRSTRVYKLLHSLCGMRDGILCVPVPIIERKPPYKMRRSAMGRLDRFV